MTASGCLQGTKRSPGFGAMHLLTPCAKCFSEKPTRYNMMHLKIKSFTIMALLIWSSGLAGAAEGKDALIHFRALSSQFSTSPISKSDFEAMKPYLRDQAFSTSDGFFWRMSDGSGAVVIAAFPEVGNFSVSFIPVPVPLGDSVLAALIAKSVNVEVGDGDAIKLTIGTQNLYDNKRTGTRTEYLKVNLRGGLWQETEIQIHWNADPPSPPFAFLNDKGAQYRLQCP